MFLTGERLFELVGSDLPMCPSQSGSVRNWLTKRLTIAVLDIRRLSTLEGRILVHGEDKAGRRSGRNYLVLEGTDAWVYHIHYTPEIEDPRSRGWLRTKPL